VSHRNDPEYPTKPRVDHLSESDREQALRDWKRCCKQFTDRRRKKILKDSERIANPDIAYSGVTIPLRGGVGGHVAPIVNNDDDDDFILEVDGIGVIEGQVGVL
jgi:hypothetical protein